MYKLILIAVIAIALAVVGIELTRKSAAPAPDTTQVDQPSPDLLKAITQARDTLPDFIKRLQAHSPADARFAIQAGIGGSTSGKPEHIWVDGLKYDGGKFLGKLADEPLTLPGMHKGVAVSVTPDQVTDWVIVRRDGGHEGEFTVKALGSP